MTRSGFAPIPGDRRYYWIRIKLPRGGDRQALQPPIGLYFDSFVALNKNELRLFKHTGGNRLIEIELPEEISEILELAQVTDSQGREYRPRHEMTGEATKQQYTVEERERRLVLWFDISRKCLENACRKASRYCDGVATMCVAGYQKSRKLRKNN